MNKLQQALERLAKWRLVFAGWQLGTRLKGDPEGDAVRHHRELSIFLRCELSATTNLLIKKGVITLDEFKEQLTEEAVALDMMYEEKFPGFNAEDYGIRMSMPEAANTMRGWKP